MILLKRYRIYEMYELMIFNKLKHKQSLIKHYIYFYIIVKHEPHLIFITHVLTPIEHNCHKNIVSFFDDYYIF